MKFSQISDGQQFEYQGVVYTRKGPLMGVDNKGNSKMIARSADVRPLDNTQAEAKTQTDLLQTITRQDALNAFATFEDHIHRCIQQLARKKQITFSDVEKCLANASSVFKAELLSD